MDTPEQSRFIPQNPYWFTDLQDRDTAHSQHPAIFGDLIHIDETYLEISKSSGKLRGMMISFSLAPFLATFYVIRLFSSDIAGLIREVPWFAVLLPFMLLGLLAQGIFALRIDLSTPRDEPIRFNRKRRKVYVSEFKHSWNPFAHWGSVAKEFDWNTIQAEITKQAGFNGKIYMVRYALVLVSVKPGTNEVVDRFTLKGNMMTTKELYATWAYCKRYMAGGPEAVPAVPQRIQEISFRRSLLHYLFFLDTTEEGRQARQAMSSVEWFAAFMLIPLYPLLLLWGLGHYIAMRYAPEAVWPADMDAESKSSPA